MAHQIPLNHEASAGLTHQRTCTTLPPEVVQCLQSARFLHLATCLPGPQPLPHVSLMNYTYLPSHGSRPVIVMTTNPASKKMNNMAVNPNVSLLVHDWVSHRPPAAAQQRRLSHDGTGGGEGGQPGAVSSLASLLFNLNTEAVSSISATISGRARLVEPGSAEEEQLRARHLENNTFEEGRRLDQGTGMFRRDSESFGNGESNERRGWFVEGEEVRVIVVDIQGVRIADFKGQVRDWVLVPEDGDAMAN